MRTMEYENGYKVGYEDGLRDGRECKNVESKQKEMYMVYDSTAGSTCFCITKAEVNAYLAERLEFVFGNDVNAMKQSISIYETTELPMQVSFPSIKIAD